MRVLITGGAGFLGSHITEHLLSENNSVLVVDNYATGRRDNLSPHPHLDVVEGSIYDEELMEELFSSFHPDVVVHAAASYKDPANWEEDIKVNVLGTAIVAKKGLKYKVKRLIYFQTSLCYGLKPQEQPITLRCPLNPEGSSYALSKTAGEKYIELSGLDFISFRLANIYGPRNLSGPIPTFYKRLSEGKKCFVVDTRRDFVYVKDFLKVVIKAIKGEGRKGYYHISSGRDYSIKEVFDEIIKSTGTKLDTEVEIRPREEDDAYTILLDPSETEKDFDWRVSTPLGKGIKEAVRWYKNNIVEETFTHLKNK